MFDWPSSQQVACMQRAGLLAGVCFQLLSLINVCVPAAVFIASFCTRSTSRMQLFRATAPLPYQQ
jgi:hypothetical protein